MSSRRLPPPPPPPAPRLGFRRQPLLQLTQRSRRHVRKANAGPSRRLRPHHVAHRPNLHSSFGQINPQRQQSVYLHLRRRLNAHPTLADIEDFAEFENRALRASAQICVGRSKHFVPAGASAPPPDSRPFPWWLRPGSVWCVP